MLLQHPVSVWQLAANIAPVIATGAGIYYRRYLPDYLGFILFAVISSLLFDSLGLALRYAHLENNAPVYNIYWFFCLWFMSMAARRLINGDLFKRMMMVTPGVVTVLGIYFVWERNWTGLTNKLYLSVCIALVFSYLLVLMQLLSVNTKKLFREPVFILCITLILYYACNIPFWAYLDYLIHHENSVARKLYGLITHPLNVFMYSSIAYCFVLAARHEKLKPLDAYG